MSDECKECMIEINPSLLHACTDCVCLSRNRSNIFGYNRCKMGADIESLYGDIYSSHICGMFAEQIHEEVQ